MLRLLARAFLVVAGACLLAGPPAQATVSGRVVWNVGLTGKETTRWTFSGTVPDTCSSYLGSPGLEAKGSGSRVLSVATGRKRRISAETYRMGGKMRFQSFSTDGWHLPATVSKTGGASVQAGKPCGSEPDDPEPLPEISDASGCGTKKGNSDPTLRWTPGRLVVDLGAGPDEPVGWLTRCPDVAEPALYILEDSTCKPKGLGTLYLSALKFMGRKPRKFTLTDEHHYVCPIPITNVNWRDGSATLTVEVLTSYKLTFTPRSTA